MTDTNLSLVYTAGTIYKHPSLPSPSASILSFHFTRVRASAPQTTTGSVVTCSLQHHGHPGPLLRSLQHHGDDGGPQAPEEAPAADGKHQGEDGLRGVRAAGEKRREIDERRDERGGEPEAEQVHGDGIRGADQGAGAGEEHGQGGGDVALRALHDDHLPLRRRRLRQEGPRGLRPQRATGHGRPQRARAQVHEHVQRRERQLMHRHVMIP